MERETYFMLPFAAGYVTFCRKKWSFMLPFAADYVTFCRRQFLYHAVYQAYANGFTTL